MRVDVCALIAVLLGVPQRAGAAELSVVSAHADGARATVELSPVITFGAVVPKVTVTDVNSGESREVVPTVAGGRMIVEWPTTSGGPFVVRISPQARAAGVRDISVRAHPDWLPICPEDLTDSDAHCLPDGRTPWCSHGAARRAIRFAGSVATGHGPLYIIVADAPSGFTRTLVASHPVLGSPGAPAAQMIFTGSWPGDGGAEVLSFVLDRALVDGHRYTLALDPPAGAVQETLALMRALAVTSSVKAEPIDSVLPDGWAGRVEQRHD